MFQLHHCHCRQIPFHHTESESSSFLEKIGQGTSGANPLVSTQGGNESASFYREKQDRVRKSKTHNHCCEEEGRSRRLSWFSLEDHKVGWDGNVSAFWRHGGGDVCCASSCTAGLPLLLLRWRCRLCHSRLLHHQTQQRIVGSRETRVHDRGVRRAAVGCLGLSRLSLRVAAGVNCASVLGDCHHFNAPPQS